MYDETVARRSNNRRTDDTHTAIAQADVLMLVYDVARPETFARVASHWLPRIRTLTQNAAAAGTLPPPVILIGNKIDLRQVPLSDAELEHQLSPVTTQYPEVPKRKTHYDLSIGSLTPVVG